MEKRHIPYDIEAEQGVLGAIIIDPEVIPQVVEVLRAEDFYRDIHQIIYGVIHSLHEQEQPADFITICDELDRRDKLEYVGGASYLTSLINYVPTSGNACYYAQIVARTARFRDVMQTAAQITTMAYQEDESVFRFAQEQFYRIGQGKGKAVLSHRQAVDEYWKSLEQLHEEYESGALVGVPTGYRKLNAILGGFRKSKFYVLAARPGEGKTALGLNFAYEAIKKNCNVLFFSIEMDCNELMQRLVAAESKVDSMHLRDARFNNDEWDQVVAGLGRLQNERSIPGTLWIDDTPANDIDTMRAKARSTQMKHGVSLIIVDYLQLAKGSNETDYQAENRRLEVERVSRNLKVMARELQVPVLALAQLNREVEGRAGRLPQLSDLREAGGIEQDCDVAMFIHRDPVVPRDATEYDVSLLIEKHRNGPKGTVGLHYKGKETRFYPAELHIVE